MLSRPFGRAVLVGAGAMLVLLLGYHLLRGPSAPPQAPADFNPAQFVRERPQLDAPYVATDYEVVDAMLAMARVRPGDDVVDLGSGDGRILIAAARSHGARGLGVDIDPARIMESNANARAAGVAGRVTFRREDLFETPLANADVLTLYLAPEINQRLRPRILGEMRPGTRVVSHDFDMGDWRPDARQQVGTATIYMWIVPARLEGTWTLTEGGRSAPLVIDQAYQDFGGTLGGARLVQGAVRGTRVRFVADWDGRRRTFNGRIEGNRIVPVDSGGWQAARAS